MIDAEGGEGGGRKVVMARFGAPHGVGGMIRVQIFSRQPAFFAAQAFWWCRFSGEGGEWRRLAVTRCFAHGGGGMFVAKLEGVEGREDAAAMRHGEAALAYADLPRIEGDFYWCDLIGLRVETAGGGGLGCVVEMMDVGVHDVACVEAEGGGRRILIPFVEKYVLRVEVAAGRMVVDWEADW